MSEAGFWFAYFCTFFVTLICGFVLGRRLWLISVVSAALCTIVLMAISLNAGGELSDPWLPAGFLINFLLAWYAAAIAIYIIKFVRA